MVALFNYAQQLHVDQLAPVNNRRGFYCITCTSYRSLQRRVITERRVAKPFLDFLSAVFRSIIILPPSLSFRLSHAHAHARTFILLTVNRAVRLRGVHCVHYPAVSFSLSPARV